MIQGHGDDRHLYEEEILADLSSNVRTEHFPEELPSLLSRELEHWTHYPEPDGGKLQKELAQLHGVKTGQVLVTNGSIEAFYLIAAAFEGGKATIPIPTFSEYEDACRTYGMSVRTVPWERLETEGPEGGELLFLCDPNNPTGRTRSPEALLELFRKGSETIGVIDEANAELTPFPSSLLPLFSGDEDLIIVRSLTKNFGIPGLRLGYIVAGEAMIERIRSGKMPWSVNGLALRAGDHVIREHGGRIQHERIQKLYERSEGVRERVERIPGFETLASDSSYFLVRMGKGKASELKERLVRDHGVLIRDAGNFKGLDERYFRISPQSPEANERLIKGLEDWSRNSRS